ncbi:MAG: Ig-like domain-containing protein, partial [Bacteroidales bacterium]
GVNWSVISGVPQGTKVNNSWPGLLVAVDGNSSLVNDRSSRIIALVTGDGVYESNDGGQNWDNTLDGTFCDIVIGPDSNVYIVSDNKGTNQNKVYRGLNEQWDDISPHSDKWKHIEVSGDNLWLSAGGGKTYYYSSDKGDNWSKINYNMIAEDVPWYDGYTTFRSGGLAYNSAKNSLWISNGNGVVEAVNPFSTDQTWYSRTLGIGILVTYDMLVAGNGNIVSVHADKGLFSASLDSPPEEQFPGYFIAGWDLGKSENNPEFIVVNINPQPWNPQGEALNGWSNDNGKTFTPFATLPPDEDGHAHLEVASNDIDNIIWVPNDNEGEIYYTKDRGDVWEKANYAGGAVNQSPGGGRIFTSERYVRSCPESPNTFYLVNGATDVYKTSDGGANWTKQNSTSLPYGFHSVFKTVPGKEGHLFYTSSITSNEPSPDSRLYHSTDSGVTWGAVPGFNEVVQVATGKAEPGANYPTVFVQGKLNGEIGLYRSTDYLETWQKIDDFPMRIFNRIQTMEGDPNIFGNIYVAFSNHGIVAGQYVDTCNTNIEWTSPQDSENFSSGASVSLSVDVTSDCMIDSVRFMSGDKILSTLTSSPFNHTWDDAADGKHTLKAVVYTEGGIAEKQIEIIVGNLVSITHPSDGQTLDVGQNIIEVTVEGVAVSSVSFYIDDEKMGEDDAPPYSYTWTQEFPGEYSIRAEAGNASHQVTVTLVAELEVDKTELTYTVEESTQSVEVFSNTNWTVTADQDWLSVSPSSGNGNGSFSVTTSENTSADARNGIITVSGSGIVHEITVQQEGTSLSVGSPRNQQISLSPNPVAGMLTISGIQQFGEIRVLDTAGQVVLVKENQGLSEVVIDTHNLLKGIYIVHLRGANKTLTTKFVRID